MDSTRTPRELWPSLSLVMFRKQSGRRDWWHRREGPASAQADWHRGTGGLVVGGHITLLAPLAAAEAGAGSTAGASSADPPRRLRYSAPDPSVAVAGAPAAADSQRRQRARGRRGGGHRAGPVRCCSHRPAARHCDSAQQYHRQHPMLTISRAPSTSSHTGTPRRGGAIFISYSAGASARCRWLQTSSTRPE